MPGRFTRRGLLVRAEQCRLCARRRSGDQQSALRAQKLYWRLRARRWTLRHIRESAHSIRHVVSATKVLTATGGRRLKSKVVVVSCVCVVCCVRGKSIVRNKSKDNEKVTSLPMTSTTLSNASRPCFYLVRTNGSISSQMFYWKKPVYTVGRCVKLRTRTSAMLEKSAAEFGTDARAQPRSAAKPAISLRTTKNVQKKEKENKKGEKKSEKGRIARALTHKARAATRRATW